MTAWALAIGLASAAVVLEPEPVESMESVLTLTDADGRPRSGETVRVLHRPGLAAEQEQAIGITDARGQVRWTPSRAGVAHVRAGDEVRPVHVTAARLRPDVPLLVALLLLGGLAAIGYGVRPRS